MPSPSFREEEIIAGIANPGPRTHAFEKSLYTEFRRLIWQRPKHLGINNEAARDAYTDAVLVVIQHLRQGRFRGESSLYTYLRKIFFNKCIDVSRKKTTPIYEDPELVFPTLADKSQEILNKIFQKEEVNRVMQAMQQLGERCQELLQLIGEGFKLKEITTMMDFANVESATSQRYQCKKKLKAIVFG
ncbi:MAG: sigma-70 family RNA polymerase sigma factor [Bacteroidota bacterium]